jgi:hypothetical protein
MQLKRTAYTVGAMGSVAVLTLFVTGSASAASVGSAWNDSPSVNECLATSENTVGLPAIMWTCDGETGQQWVATMATNGYVSLKTTAGCLDTMGGAEGSKVYVEKCDNSTNQGWFEYGQNSSGYNEWASYSSGWCLSVSEGSTANGASVITWKCQGTPDQWWGGSLGDLA